MGGNISKPGDIFYPDNPNRRARAQQLKNDTEDYARQFEDLRKHRDEVLKEIKPRLSQFLHKYGYNSPDELDNAVKNILKGDALADYIRISQQIDKSDEIQSILFQVIGIVSVASGVIIGGLVVLGVITGGAAWAAIGAIGLVLGIVAGFAFLFSGIFDGAEERSNMRKAIRDLSYERVKARAALEAMRALSNWVENIKMWLDEPLIIDNEAIMKKKIEGDFSDDFNKSKRPYIVQYLKGRDRERGAWTNEDPNWWDGPYDILPVGNARVARAAPLAMAATVEPESNKFPIEASTINCSYSNSQESGTVKWTFVSSDEKTCKAVDPEKNEWVITYESGADNQQDPQHLKLENFRFILKNITSGKVLDNCTLKILKTTLT
ncbi:hypothetical protein AX16_005027 [Volvariella volvacea WC 439]|nr:hypothetical protein AX16_005027 [Volvariella volvacea WC 439]